MVCNVYSVRGRYFEVCAPYTMPAEASLSELSHSRYMVLPQKGTDPFARQRLDRDMKIEKLAARLTK